jgi:hypothetical protein
MSTPAEILKMQAAEEVRQRIMNSPDCGGPIPKPVEPPTEPTAEDRRLAYRSAEKFVMTTGRLVVGSGEDTVRLELRSRGGGQLLTDADIDELVRLARSEGAARRPASYLARRAEAIRFADGRGRGLEGEKLEKALAEFDLDEQDVRSLVRRASGEL